MLPSYDQQLLQRVFAQDAAIGSVFNLFIKAISPKLARLKDGGWANNPTIEKEIDYELERLRKNLEAVITNNQKWAFLLSKVKNDELVKRYIQGMSLSAMAKDKLFNHGALEAFIARKDGFTVSERVWNITKQTKQQLDFYLESGIATGRSAARIAQDIKQILNDPDKVFRRVRNEKGELVPSKPMKDYHPGQGVFRSAKKNAVRLAANETNLVYRMSDHSRWQNLDFIVGYEVKLSSNHPVTDICDYMKGVYPKDFVFSGWHTSCFCHAEPIMMQPEDFIDYINADEITARNILEKYNVKDMPQSAMSYIEKNKEAISRYKNPPYWVRDNFKGGSIVNGLLI